MRLAFTREFNERRIAHTKAYDAAEHSELAMEDPEWIALDQFEGEKLNELMLNPAGTAKGVSVKIDHYVQREMYGWRRLDGKNDYAEALKRDLIEISRPGISLHKEFATYYQARIEQFDGFGRGVESEDPEGEKAFQAICDAFLALLAAPCTTPGDFILKSYVNLLEGEGCTLYGPAKADMTGSIWDIDLSNAQDDTHDQAYIRSAYYDIDNCDLGACLLAFGSPDFSAEAWMERADAVGLKVGVGINTAGARSFWIREDGYSEDPRIQREQRRLHRLWAYGDEDRNKLIIDEILEEWPQLVTRTGDLLAC